MKITRCHVAFASLCTILLAAACGGAPATRAVRAPAPAVAAPALAPRTAPAERASVFVDLDAVADRSTPAASRSERAERAAAMRAIMTDDLSAAPAITLAREAASTPGIARFTVDATIERLDQRVSGRFVEISCELRVAVTDGRGKMLFFLTNRAAVRVPARGFRAEFAAPLQRDALEGAARKLNGDLIRRLSAETRGLSGPAIAAAQ